VINVVNKIGHCLHQGIRTRDAPPRFRHDLHRPRACESHVVVWSSRADVHLCSRASSRVAARNHLQNPLIRVN